MLALGDDWDVDFEMLRGLQKWFHLAPYLGLWHDSYFHVGHVVSIIETFPGVRYIARKTLQPGILLRVAL